MTFQQHFGPNVNIMFPGLLPVPNYSTLPPGNAAIPEVSLMGKSYMCQPAAEAGAIASPMRMLYGETNPVTLCKLGQETVGEIIYRLQKGFESLRFVAPPNGSAKGFKESSLRKVQIQDFLRAEVFEMRNLRMIYKTLNEITDNMEMGLPTAESLVPLMDEWDGKNEERKQSESYKSLVAERAVLRERVSAVNKEIKEVLDLQRRSIWEITCQLSMVRS